VQYTIDLNDKRHTIRAATHRARRSNFLDYGICPMPPPQGKGRGGGCPTERVSLSERIGHPPPLPGYDSDQATAQ